MAKSRKRSRKGHQLSSEPPFEAQQMGDGSFSLNFAHTDPSRIKREREVARRLRQSSWWNEKLQQGLCHYCGEKFGPADLTMDHVVPLARGGESSKTNLVASCRSCNQTKKLKTPAEELLDQLAAERGRVEPERGDEED